MWMSAGAPHLCLAAGRVWFEVEVLKASSCMVVGFAGTNFGERVLGGEQGWGVWPDGVENAV
jgi:hypothetical protein